MGLKERKSGVKLVSALPPLLKQQSPLSSIKQHSAEASHTEYANERLLRDREVCVSNHYRHPPRDGPTQDGGTVSGPKARLLVSLCGMPRVYLRPLHISTNFGRALFVKAKSLVKGVLAEEG
jgi:hypothetical protein